MVAIIYQLSLEFPDSERYGLTSDIRRAANSVAHNIAEGYGRYEPRDKTRFYKISRGSANEVISQIMVASKLGYLKMSENESVNSYKEIISELDRLIKTVETR